MVSTRRFPKTPRLRNSFQVLLGCPSERSDLGTTGWVSNPTCGIGPLHDPVTSYKIKNTGEQVAQWDFQNNAPAFVLEVPLRDLLTNIFNFVPFDQVVQRAYFPYKSGISLTRLLG